MESYLAWRCTRYGYFHSYRWNNAWVDRPKILDGVINLESL
ncbi:hypothetical protein [Prochlorococcus sp. MIT 1307]|nr:hypothetical protein [Prochlorococcus sp. MIT 1307]